MVEKATKFAVFPNTILNQQEARRVNQAWQELQAGHMDRETYSQIAKSVEMTAVVRANTTIPVSALK